jgi:hypothetical protein
MIWLPSWNVAMKIATSGRSTIRVRTTRKPECTAV